VSLPVVLRPEASQYAQEARDHYEALRVGLGQTFLNRLDEVLTRINAMPKLYGVAWRNVRAARLRQFTYVVYFRVHDDLVEVLAVMHSSRDASGWQVRA